MASRPGPEAAKQPQTITLTYCLYDAIFYEMLCWFYARCTMNFQNVQLLLYQSTERLFPKHNLWIWLWARALNFFGRPSRGMLWVESVLLNRCMVLTTVLQLSFRILTIFL